MTQWEAMAVALTLLAKDEDSGRTGCPSVYLDDDGMAVVQAPEVDSATAGQLLNVLPGEVGVRIKPEVLLAAADKLRAAQG
jgi:hypothetical protein